jgi:outer membrane immunogenic protein
MIFRNIAFMAGAAAVVLAAGETRAADLPVKARVAPAAVVASSGWAGPYIGLFGGYGFGRARASEPTDPNLFFPFYNGTDVPYSFDASGFFAGATVGFNMQSGALVYGLEGEAGYLGLRGSLIDPNGTIFFGTPDTVTTFKSDFYGALYGRLGISSGQTLFYGKGGVAFLNANASTIDPCAGPPGCGTTTLTMTGNKLMVGWSAGAGVEWMFGAGWSAKAEYAYFDFGSIQTAGPSSAPNEFYRQTIDVTAHTAKLGINYRFGAAPVMARY